VPLGYGSHVDSGAETLVRRRDDLITEAVLDDVVVLDPETSRYVRLNRSSALLWEALQPGPAPVGRLAEILEQQAGAAADRALGDALAFVEAMASRGLVELSEPG
jgi:hypothetical protein